MDPTIIAAIAGGLGVILGAVIGGVLPLKATKRQIKCFFRAEVTWTGGFMIKALRNAVLRDSHHARKTKGK